MSENCDNLCTSCNENCSDRKEEQIDFTENLNQYSSVKKVIGVVSGKGGVGKSLVTSMLAVAMNRAGYKSAILDADITGPSIPKAFGIHSKALSNEFGLLPSKSSTGIDIMSINLLLENESDPVVWRGPIIAGTVKQFWTDVIWKDIDFMFIDMPPGTGDVPLTVFQSIKVDAIVVVTSPQELVSMIVSKAVNMAKMMNIKVLGLVENMSYFLCPDNNKRYNIFGESNIDEIAKSYGLDVLAKIPIDPNIAKACDKGIIESYNETYLDKLSAILEKTLISDNNQVEAISKVAIASNDGQVASHFGHCEEFIIYDIHNKKIINKEIVKNPGHKPGFLPNFLHEKKVELIISGGMGSGAIDIFNEKNIKVIIGAKGLSDHNIKLYIDGELKSTASACTDHHIEFSN